MYLENKEYYWTEMSHYVYSVLSQKQRLLYEYEEEQDKIVPNRLVVKQIYEELSREE